MSLSLYNFEQIAGPFSDVITMTPLEHGLQPPKQKDLERAQSTTSITSTRKAKPQAQQSQKKKKQENQEEEPTYDAMFDAEQHLAFCAFFATQFGDERSAWRFNAII